MKPTRLLLVDDQPILLDGLEALLSNEKEFEIIGRAENGIEAVAKAKEFQPDVVLMDISMPEMDGIEATRALLKCCKESKVLIFSMYNNKEFVHEILNAGASGYVLKNTGKQELLTALLAVATGKTYLCEAVRAAMAQGDQHKERSGENGNFSLTKREREIALLICAGRSSQNIAENLFISPQTVETHRKNILHKLDIRNSAGIVKYAMERGWKF